MPTLSLIFSCSHYLLLLVRLVAASFELFEVSATPCPYLVSIAWQTFFASIVVSVIAESVGVSTIFTICYSLTNYQVLILTIWN